MTVAAGATGKLWCPAGPGQSPKILADPVSDGLLVHIFCRARIVRLGHLGLRAVAGEHRMAQHVAESLIRRAVGSVRIHPEPGLADIAPLEAGHRRKVAEHGHISPFGALVRDDLRLLVFEVPVDPPAVLHDPLTGEAFALMPAAYVHDDDVQ